MGVIEDGIAYLFLGLAGAAAVILAIQVTMLFSQKTHRDPHPARCRKLRIQPMTAMVTINPEGTERISNMAHVVTINDTIEQPVVVKDRDGTVLPDAEVRFSSSDDAILTVEDLGGSYKATALGNGASQVLVSVEAGETDIEFGIDVLCQVGNAFSATAGEPVITANDAPAETPPVEPPVEPPVV